MRRDAIVGSRDTFRTLRARGLSAIDAWEALAFREYLRFDGSASMLAPVPRWWRGYALGWLTGREVLELIALDRLASAPSTTGGGAS